MTEPMERFAGKWPELVFTPPPSPTRTATHLPPKRSLLLLRAVFHVSSTLLDRKAEYDSRDGKEALQQKFTSVCLLEVPLRELNPQPLDISIIDVL